MGRGPDTLDADRITKDDIKGQVALRPVRPLRRIAQKPPLTLKRLYAGRSQSSTFPYHRSV